MKIGYSHSISKRQTPFSRVVLLLLLLLCAICVLARMHSLWFVCCFAIVKLILLGSRQVFIDKTFWPSSKRNATLMNTTTRTPTRIHPRAIALGVLLNRRPRSHGSCFACYVAFFPLCRIVGSVRLHNWPDTAIQTQFHHIARNSREKNGSDKHCGTMAPIQRHFSYPFTGSPSPSLPPSTARPDIMANDKPQCLLIPIDGLRRFRENGKSILIFKWTKASDVDVAGYVCGCPWHRQRSCDPWQLDHRSIIPQDIPSGLTIEAHSMSNGRGACVCVYARARAHALRPHRKDVSVEWARNDSERYYLHATMR